MARRQAEVFSVDIDRMSRPLATALRKFFTSIAKREVDALLDAGMLDVGALPQLAKSTRIAKALTPDDVVLYADLISAFGVRRIDSAGKRIASALAPGSWELRPELIDEFMLTKEIRIQEWMDGTNKQLAEDVRRVLGDMAQREPKPTGRETARALLSVTTEGGGAFSAMRADRIARTETASAENFGIYQGQIAAGVGEIEWLTITDGRQRHTHDELDGQITKVGTPFQLDNGRTLMFPGDPNGHPEEIINCRCTTAPVIKGRK